jgi:hypothetical protein
MNTKHGNGSSMNFTVTGMEVFGFSKPIPFQEIERSSVLGKTRGTPDMGGVYVVHRPAPLVPETVEVVYIGKGSLGKPRARGARRGLWHRMRQYRNAVFRGGSSHDGGKLLRDLPDKENLLIQALGVAEDHDTCMEYFLIDAFRNEYKKLPLANVVLPAKPTSCCQTLEQAAEYRIVGP